MQFRHWDSCTTIQGLQSALVPLCTDIDPDTLVILCPILHVLDNATVHPMVLILLELTLDVLPDCPLLNKETDLCGCIAVRYNTLGRQVEPRNGNDSEMTYYGENKGDGFSSDRVEGFAEAKAVTSLPVLEECIADRACDERVLCEPCKLPSHPVLSCPG